MTTDELKAQIAEAVRLKRPVKHLREQLAQAVHDELRNRLSKIYVRQFWAFFWSAMVWLFLCVVMATIFTTLRYFEAGFLSICCGVTAGVFGFGAWRLYDDCA